ncbi:MAG: heme-binding protein [Betaproteobacteria bacterium HGW-Betaproteobacteria-22]|nr:MAG: heme-binding protein [Betaproteobacteria bacterium HGW-Betaproteobacteria-22]
MAIEEPKYTVLENFGAIELRAYAPRVVAETLVDGSLDNASSVGFKRIADYIFGNNTAHNGSNEKISMTAPVTTAPSADKRASQKISMTTPVSIQETTGQWRMYFVMPSQYTLNTLPTPNNPAVSLRELPPSRMAVLRFSGLAGEEKTAKKIAELLAWLKSKDITPISEPELARYNPPWTLPFLRRNEVMVAY